MRVRKVGSTKNEQRPKNSRFSSSCGEPSRPFSRQLAFAHDCRSVHTRFDAFRILPRIVVGRSIDYPVGSKTIRSARYPGAMTPRSLIPNLRAGSDVILRMASSTEIAPLSLA